MGRKADNMVQLTRAQRAALLSCGYGKDEIESGYALRSEEESAADCERGCYLPSDRAVRYAWKLLASISAPIADALMAQRPGPY